jgi:hypothetical protein
MNGRDVIAQFEPPQCRYPLIDLCRLLRRSNWLPRRSYCEPHYAICVVPLNARALLPSI